MLNRTMAFMAAVVMMTAVTAIPTFAQDKMAGDKMGKMTKGGKMSHDKMGKMSKSGKMSHDKMGRSGKMSHDKMGKMGKMSKGDKMGGKM